MEYKFTDQNFDEEVLKSELPVLVNFYADWCGPCQMMAPVIEEITKKMEARLPSLGAKATSGQGKVKVGKLNVDENQQTASQYGIMSIPTLILFKNGKAAKTIVGFRGKEEIIKEISNNV